MSNPATVFRTCIHVPLAMITPPGPKDDRIKISIDALNAQGAVSAAWPNGIHRTCVSCDHFGSANEVCSLAGRRPPARIIAFGCEQYADDMDVPF